MRTPCLRARLAIWCAGRTLSSGQMFWKKTTPSGGSLLTRYSKKAELRGYGDLTVSQKHYGALM